MALNNTWEISLILFLVAVFFYAGLSGLFIAFVSLALGFVAAVLTMTDEEGEWL